MFQTISFTNIFFLYVVMVWFMFHSCLSDAHQVKHFLHYKFTVLTKSNTFPEFSAVIVADGRRIKHFSNEEKVWILTVDDRTEPPKDSPDSSKWFIRQIRTLSNCTNSQCSELHVLQRIIGCELEKLPDGTVSLTVFDEYGFDGEDFISFNSDTMKWIDKSPKAKETKKKWDRQTERNQYIKYFFKSCMNWISTFNNTKQSSPDVRVSARKAAPDDHSNLVLTCLATGFYPRDVQMNIRLYRNILEHQTSSGIRPNDDETFQMRISVKIDCNYEGSYDCLLIHSSLTEPVTVKWDGACFDCETEILWLYITGAAATLLLLVLVLICWWIDKKKLSNEGGIRYKMMKLSRSWTCTRITRKEYYLRPPDLRPPDLEPPNLRPPDLEPTDLRPLVLEPTDLRPPYLRPLDLEPTDLRPPYLRPLDLELTDLRPLDLEPTDLRPTDLRPLDLEPPDLRPLDLEPPDLEPPDLEVLRPPDLGVLRPPDLEVLRPPDLGVLRPPDLEVLRPPDLEVLRPPDLEVLRQSDLEVLRPPDLGGHRARKIASLTSRG
ncbi:RLA class I histocompatibility antigen, alpha chain 11/11-like isoform X1 [Ctenopharyngodon idella]|uniref:RLA class I histocompatibility antigen, alpha chain 11/11-like isoform X1 n=1 Tax=Ctenopharyngodon idella TaxID=7959 RepID=UPI002231A176|nr:RLA class I histocompatibility antigen, alpha chain 11/11-like isoform X1 [Ctenopharyngodon idella]